ncbi:glycoside hydrolase family 26 protein [Desulfovibrio inopinatus]|uniref:glycoside hydrolase family 26 protein n=1 Tax=Desulfovibrio inopinatus TaxID=102109 RepID=UPI00041DC426|nr:glycosyl hydrolase [Desulfovibrio inopinatus]
MCSITGDEDTPADFNRRVGTRHAFSLDFFSFPEVLSGEIATRLDLFVRHCMAAGAIPLLTLETKGGLNSYSREDIETFIETLAQYDTPILVRYNHEMNGSWYPWGQQPTLYVSKFREFAGIAHENAENVAMAWTPGQGWGYPYAGGAYTGSVDSDPALDTNSDGVLTSADDPYAPFYPGDEAVDWVGFSLYHWGNTGMNRNEIPTPLKWYHANGFEDDVPNFHDLYAKNREKPMIVAETSAFYDPTDSSGGGADEYAIKSGWLNQIFHFDTNSAYALPMILPELKAVCWFDRLKYEEELQGDVDWRITGNARALAEYAEIAKNPSVVASTRPVDYIESVHAPSSIVPGQRVTVEVRAETSQPRKLKVNLLTYPEYRYITGASHSVEAGQHDLVFTLNVPTEYVAEHAVFDVLLLPLDSPDSSALDHVQPNVSLGVPSLLPILLLVVS